MVGADPEGTGDEPARPHSTHAPWAQELDEEVAGHPHSPVSRTGSVFALTEEGSNGLMALSPRCDQHGPVGEWGPWRGFCGFPRLSQVWLSESGLS